MKKKRTFNLIINRNRELRTPMPLSMALTITPRNIIALMDYKTISALNLLIENMKEETFL